MTATAANRRRDLRSAARRTLRAAADLWPALAMALFLGLGAFAFSTSQPLALLASLAQAR